MIEDIVLTTVLILTGISSLLFIGFRRFEGRIVSIIDSVGGLLEEMFTGPTISKAFGILGSASGDARGKSAMADKLATDILNGPKFGALKMGAGALGIDLDGYIEEHGAMNTITGLQSIAGALGIDVNQIISSGAAGLTDPTAGGGGGANPYL